MLASVDTPTTIVVAVETSSDLVSSTAHGSRSLPGFPWHREQVVKV